MRQRFAYRRRLAGIKASSPPHRHLLCELQYAGDQLPFARFMQHIAVGFDFTANKVLQASADVTNHAFLD